MVDRKTRLHITPLTPALLSAILPPSKAALAENVSYHELQTFPENNYGYLELSSMEAESLKKKLNGSILKGKKIRIEEARPRKRALDDREAGAQDEPGAASGDDRTRSKRAKRDPGTISGHELPANRKVKRGWTEPKKGNLRKSPKGNSNQVSSKYTDKAEILFRTKVPPNKSKASKSHSKKGKENSRDVLVHEFEKSTIQPSFLRQDDPSDMKSAVEYVDGKGWINEHGDVVEEESKSFRKRQERPAAKDHQSKELVDQHTQLSRRKGQKTPVGERPLQRKGAADSPQDKPEPLANETNLDDETSSAGSSSSGSESASESHLTASSSRQPDVSKGTSVEATSTSTSTSTSTETQTTPTPSVHPLEAIFKRPTTKAASADIAKPSLELQTSFSFFEPEAAEEGEEAAPPPGPPPDTPFNSQELRSRRELRSAAPTPDTAAPSRFNSWGSQSRNAVDSEEDDSLEDNQEQKTSKAGKATTGIVPSKKTAASTSTVVEGESDFAKFFWEHRGDNNRAWKRRAREAKKENRQRENRRRGTHR